MRFFLQLVLVTLVIQYSLEDTLSVPRCCLAATSNNELALFAGGGQRNYSPNVPYNTVDIYNALTNTWTTASLSQARMALAAATVGPLSLFGGGFDGNSYS